MPRIHIKHSRLTDGGPAIVVAAGVSLFLVLCLMVLLTNHIVPSYGLRVRPAESHFVMGSYDRDLGHVVSVAPGDTPRIFVESRALEGGVAEFEQCLDSWDCPTPSRVRVLLVVDRAVPAGTMTELADMVLAHGFTCGFAGVPAQK